MGLVFLKKKNPKNNGRAQSELRILGQGFFGRVKLCRWLSPHSGELVDVAVKQMLPNASPSSQLQFLVETRVLGTLSHPNIVPLLGFSQEICSPMAILEFMPNGDLKVCFVFCFVFCSFVNIVDIDADTLSKTYLRLCRPEALPAPTQTITSSDVAGVGIQLAQAMAYLEERRIVHRDLAARFDDHIRDVNARAADRRVDNGCDRGLAHEAPQQPEEHREEGQQGPHDDLPSLTKFSYMFHLVYYLLYFYFMH
jgi:hypothetical protein